MPPSALHRLPSPARIAIACFGKRTPCGIVAEDNQFICCGLQPSHTAKGDKENNLCHTHAKISVLPKNRVQQPRAFLLSLLFAAGRMSCINSAGEKKVARSRTGSAPRKRFVRIRAIARRHSGSLTWLSHAVHRAGPGWSVGFSRERIDFCCHDKVVSVDPTNLVRSDGHRHSTPSGRIAG